MENKELVKEFGDLLTMCGVTKVVKFGTHEIVLKTLTYDEQSNIMEAMSSVADGKDTKRMDIVQKELLAASIETIDGKTLTKEQKLFILGNGQAALCNMLFNEYEALIGEQNKTLEDVKKNSSMVVLKTP